MFSTKKTMVSVAALAAMAGCSPFEAGSSLDRGNFGVPTRNNQLVQAAYLNQGGLIADLGRKFAREVPVMVNFEFDRANLTPQARAILDQQAAFIRRFPEIEFSVFGHTDLVGSNAYNQGLGRRRAQAVVNYLVTRGVRRGQLRALVSFGETRPLIQTQQPELQNRRTVTEVTGFAADFVGDDLDGRVAARVYDEYITDSRTQIQLSDGG